MHFFVKATFLISFMTWAASLSAMNTQQIQTVNNVVDKCEKCVASCMSGHHHETNCAPICRDCADICSLMSQFISRKSQFTGSLNQACISACQQCADQC
ncbi:MAG TPA: four-helix bundle copper-binding protein, partial [Myxococcota bacterium]|nr:four-helix bundle copper-binding protein [Myxococcota bacterium]